jgi:hypothetical protein
VLLACAAFTALQWQAAAGRPKSQLEVGALLVTLAILANTIVLLVLRGVGPGRTEAPGGGGEAPLTDVLSVADVVQLFASAAGVLLLAWVVARVRRMLDGG